MNYKIGVFVDEYLTLLEFQEKAYEELKNCDIKLFLLGKLAEDASLDIPDSCPPELDETKKCDIVLLLCKVEEQYFKGFDGTVVDITGSSFSDKYEVIRVNEPILKIVQNINTELERLEISLQLPAIIYGKDGVEDLMRQSRDIFTFADNEDLVFTNRIAFNMHLQSELKATTYLYNTLGVLREGGAEVDISFIPLSTVFRLDVHSDIDFDLIDSEGYVTHSGFFMASDVSETDKVFVVKHRFGYSFFADYSKLLVASIIDILKEVAS